MLQCAGLVCVPCMCRWCMVYWDRSTGRRWGEWCRHGRDMSAWGQKSQCHLRKGQKCIEDNTPPPTRSSDYTAGQDMREVHTPPLPPAHMRERDQRERERDQSKSEREKAKERGQKREQRKWEWEIIWCTWTDANTLNTYTHLGMLVH